MSIFKIDTITEKTQPFQNIQSAIVSQVQPKPGVDPEHKVRMSFRDLKTIDGRKLPNVEMLIDPQSVQVSKRVIQRKVQTKGGWVVQFWGHDITQISVNTISGNYEPTYGLALNLPINARSGRDLSEWGNGLLARWSKGGGPLKVFEKIKEWVFARRHDYNKPWKGNPLITMVWEDSLYSGYFTDFNYNINSTQPFNIAYSFTFMVLSRRDMGVGDVFGATDLKKFVSDPLGTVLQKTKQLTSVGLSYARKKTVELINNNPVGNKINEKMDVVDELPNKLTLW